MTSLLFTGASGVWTQPNRSTNADFARHSKVSALAFSQNSHVHLNICSDVGEFAEAPVRYKISNLNPKTQLLFEQKSFV